MALVQVVALLGVAYWALPHSKFAVDSRSLVCSMLSLQILADPSHGISAAVAGVIQERQCGFIVKLLWLQVVTAPCYGLSVVVSSVLQAARRYDFIPRFEVAITILRFVVLVVGVNSGVRFLLGGCGPDRGPGLPLAGSRPLGDGSRPGPPAEISGRAAGPITRR